MTYISYSTMTMTSSFMLYIDTVSISTIQEFINITSTTSTIMTPVSTNIMISCKYYYVI